jgi:hypothetical protein
VPFVDPGYYKVGCKPLLSAMGRWGTGSTGAVPASISGTILISGTEAEGLLWGPDALIGNIVLVYHGTFNVPPLSGS